eukprot:2611968-Pyramimonas_sp.AAC.1
MGTCTASSSVIDMFIVEQQLANAVRDIDVDFDWDARPHFPVVLDLPPDFGEVKVLQFPTIPPLPSSFDKDEEGEDIVHHSTVSWDKVLDHISGLISALGNRHKVVLRLNFASAYAHWANAAELELAQRTATRIRERKSTGLRARAPQPILRAISKNDRAHK